MEKLSVNNKSKIYIIDSDYRIVRCNDALKETFPESEGVQICFRIGCANCR